MKIRNQGVSGEDTSAFAGLLSGIRERRGFDALSYIAAKAAALNGYMARCKLSACVVALSGGIDSAVVLALVSAAAAVPNSPIRRIVPIALPVAQSDGVTGQAAAAARAEEMAAHLGLKLIAVDLSSGLRRLAGDLEYWMRAANYLSSTGGQWARGQFASYLRTPMVYYVTSLLTQEGFPAVVVGTTNRDEGAYLGYFGKASDGMVDIQLVSDLHKSEVRALAAHFDLPVSIREVPPTGDMFDGKVDEEVFGAPYDAVELLIALKTANVADNALIQREVGMMDEPSRQRLGEWFDNLEKLHDYNAHKYQVGSPAVHLDVLPSSCPGGWDHEPPALAYPEPALMHGVVSLPGDILAAMAKESEG